MLSWYNFLHHYITIKSYSRISFFHTLKMKRKNSFLSKEDMRAVEKWEPAKGLKEHMCKRARAQVTSAAAAGAQVRQTSTGHARGRSSSNSQAGREREKREREGDAQAHTKRDTPWKGRVNLKRNYI